MCGRFIQISNPDKIKVHISKLEVPDEVCSGFRPSYNLTPARNILTVLNLPVPCLAFTRWGLIPFWAKDGMIGQRMINARAETLLEKNSFKAPLRKRRCIILTDGFYEWKSSGRVKTPFFIRLREAGPFGLAGLWDQWTDPATGETVRSSTIITTSPNGLVSGIHNRMPAVLKPRDYALWLNPGSVADHELMTCIAPYPEEDMEAYEVSRAVNNPLFDSPECIVRATYHAGG